MDGTGLLILLIGLFIQQTDCNFYHEPSRILIQAEDHESHNDSYFGYAIAYQKHPSPRLIIGAPRYDLDGKVYTCEVEDGLKDNNVRCSPVDINIQELAHTTRKINPNQHFYLGASIAVTRDYLLTCAPMWTSDGTADVRPSMYGTCFVYNGTAYRYRTMDTHTGNNWRGYGWNILADEVNSKVFITKPIGAVDMLILPYNDALSPAKSLRNEYSFGDVYNVGQGLVAGQFFGNYTSYAFSYTSKGTKGQISFLRYTDKGFEGVKLGRRSIQDGEIGAMFGYTLCSADIDHDGFSELIVGSPAHVDRSESKEVGAVHIYSMNHNNTIDSYFRGIIFGVQEGSRFGTAIAADDIDGDTLPEIFISAPYENENGVVYIVSGEDINNVMFNERFIHINRLKHTQRITGEGHRKFGFNIKIVPDVDGNGCNELAVGSPGDSYVALYRCLHNIKADIYTNLVGNQIVSVKVKEFKVNVCVNISYRAKPKTITSKILVTNKIIGDALIPEPNFEIDLSKKEPLVCKNITVILNNYEKENYNFTSDLNDEMQKFIKIKDFSSSWAVLSPTSKRTKTLEIYRSCSGDECMANLSMNISLDKKDFLLGSNNVESVNITVHNHGFNSFGACIFIDIRGATVDRLNCSKETETGFVCFMPKPLKMYKKHVVNVLFNMSNSLSTDEKLDIEVKLYETCSEREKPKEQTKLTIPFILTADGVTLDGSSAVRNISDKELQNAESEKFYDNHEYSVVNNGSITWLGLQISIKMKILPFIIEYKVSASEKNCIEVNHDEFMEFNCIFDLDSYTTKKFMAVAYISKEILKDFFNQTAVNTSSEARISFPRVDLVKTLELATTINFQKELSMGDNKLLIIVIGIIIALLILIVIAIVLYKYNFFQRKQKKRLDELRDSWRRKAVRKKSERSDDAAKRESNEEPFEYVEMEVMEEPFDEAPTTSGDDVQLIEEEAQVHCSAE